MFYINIFASNLTSYIQINMNLQSKRKRNEKSIMNNRVFLVMGFRDNKRILCIILNL